MPEAICSTAVYFKNVYEDAWIVDPFNMEMIRDVDDSTVLASGVIDSPVFGKIPPERLSGGVKTLMLIRMMPEKAFHASQCGDNCAPWLLKMTETEDRTINPRGRGGTAGRYRVLRGAGAGGTCGMRSKGKRWDDVFCSP